MPRTERRYQPEDLYKIVPQRERRTLEANMQVSSTQILGARMLVGALAESIRYEGAVSSPWEALEQRVGNCFAFCELVCRTAKYLREDKNMQLDQRRATNGRHWWPFIKAGDTWLAAEHFVATSGTRGGYGAICPVTDEEHIAVLESGEGKIVTPIDYKDTADWRDLVSLPSEFEVHGIVDVTISREPIILTREE